MITKNAKRIVVICNGRVGMGFCEKRIKFNTQKGYKIIAFCEGPRAADDSTGLTSFYAYREAEQLALAKFDRFEQKGIELHFPLDSGAYLSGKTLGVEAFPAKVKEGQDFVELPQSEVLDRRHATVIGRQIATSPSC
ncbi:MAG: hypothetical protein AAF483_28340, partial [Planctomycetota bacterium]